MKITEEQTAFINSSFQKMKSKSDLLDLLNYSKEIIYGKEFIQLGKEYQTKNVWAKYKSLSEADQKNQKVINALKELDVNVNINWPLVHYKSAVAYLQQNSEDIAATGGTNWQKYLPPRFQKRIFYPEIWSPEEIEDWGKGWVVTNVFKS